MKNLPKVLFFILVLNLVAIAQTPAIRVANAASGAANDFTPGSLILINGSNLSTITASSPDQNTPFTVINGVSVMVGGVPAGLFYVSPNQIRALIDPSTPTGPATVGVSSPTFNGSTTVTIGSTVAPGLFAVSNTGTREGSILNADTFHTTPFSVTTGGKPTRLSLFGTGFDLTNVPSMTMGGMSATVSFYGPALCCLGMQQIDVTVPAALAGAGRVEIIANSDGMNSNVVEAVILPNVGQGPYPPTAENAPRNREIGALAVLPLVGQALVADEADDVVRVVDVRQRAVVRTISLAAGSQPFAVAVNDNGAAAVVAERARGKVAFINLNQGVVLSELDVDPGPAAVVLSGDTAVVASEDTDMITLISVSLRQSLGTIPVDRGPRSVAVDANAAFAYVANQDAGTVSVIDITRRAVVNTIQLGANARPRTIRLLPGTNLLAVTEPDAGVIDLIDLANNNAVTKVQTMATDLTFSDTMAYVANQLGASTLAMPINTLPNGASGATSIPLDIGLRSLAVDSTDHLLLVSSESSGTVTLIDTGTNKVTGTINAVPDDRLNAVNMPVISSLAPKQAMAGTTVQLTVNGTPLAGTFNVFFAHADGTVDPTFQITGASVESTGQQITLTVQVPPDAAKGDHILRVFTPNGESTPVAQASNVLTIL